MENPENKNEVQNENENSNVNVNSDKELQENLDEAIGKEQQSKEES